MNENSFPLLPDPEISSDVIRRIQDGDRAAWDDLYHRYRDRLLLYIRCRIGRRLRSRLQSEDILQSVFKDAVVDLDRFVPEGKEALGRYLHVCVLNKIRSKVAYFDARKRSGDVPLLDDEVQKLADPRSVDLGYHDSRLFDRLEECLETLPDSMREVILLRLFESRTNEDVATRLGKSPDATSKLYNRALARLGILMSGVRKP
jgi:RNA polymerase sigma-70 factor (ECF subfamily)